MTTVKAQILGLGRPTVSRVGTGRAVSFHETVLRNSESARGVGGGTPAPGLVPKPMIFKEIEACRAELAQMVLCAPAMTRRSHLHAVSRRSTFFEETRATDVLPDEQSGVRALPKASLPLPHPAALGSAGMRMLLSPVAEARTRTRFVPELRLEQSEYQLPSEASMHLLLARAQRKARIKQAAAEASLRLAKLLREQEETYREEMIWRAKLREVKQRLEQEAERKASLTAAKAQRAIAQQDECTRQEEAEWQAAIIAARRRHR